MTDREELVARLRRLRREAIESGIQLMTPGEINEHLARTVPEDVRAQLARAFDAYDGPEINGVTVIEWPR